MDSDRDGLVGMEEFKTALHSMHLGLSDEQVQVITILQYDTKHTMKHVQCNAVSYAYRLIRGGISASSVL
jgi:hypothetical protein